MNTEVLRKEARLHTRRRVSLMSTRGTRYQRGQASAHSSHPTGGYMMVPTPRMREFSLSNGHRARELAAVRFKARSALLLSLPTFWSRQDKD